MMRFRRIIVLCMFLSASILVNAPVGIGQEQGTLKYLPPVDATYFSHEGYWHGFVRVLSDGQGHVLREWGPSIDKLKPACFHSQDGDIVRYFRNPSKEKSMAMNHKTVPIIEKEGFQPEPFELKYFLSKNGGKNLKSLDSRNIFGKSCKGFEYSDGQIKYELWFDEKSGLLTNMTTSLPHELIQQMVLVSFRPAKSDSITLKPPSYFVESK